MAFFAGRKVLTSSKFGGAVVKCRGIWYLTGVQPMSLEDIKAQEQREKEKQEKKGGEQPSGEGKPPSASKEATAPKKEGGDNAVVDEKQKKHTQQALTYNIKISAESTPNTTAATRIAKIHLHRQKINTINHKRQNAPSSPQNPTKPSKQSSQTQARERLHTDDHSSKERSIINMRRKARHARTESTYSDNVPSSNKRIDRTRTRSEEQGQDSSSYEQVSLKKSQQDARSCSETRASRADLREAGFEHKPHSSADAREGYQIGREHHQDGPSTGPVDCRAETPVIARAKTSRAHRNNGQTATLSKERGGAGVKADVSRASRIGTPQSIDQIVGVNDAGSGPGEEAHRWDREGRAEDGRRRTRRASRLADAKGMEEELESVSVVVLPAERHDCKVEEQTV
ncbi:hypothetical protein Tdes44962_MAKER09505 [Teratosphaeria destructans]|uniref:Uncharacterized protein n=1 Tax=Teratosphaeria destructans TaxID=418781 RepID=A0A9W7W330_9PEZI|nr:hypothetical protein Tdes44962_MAKER09505 [Teratosphaeria destructans]